MDDSRCGYFHNWWALTTTISRVRPCSRLTSLGVRSCPAVDTKYLSHSQSPGCLFCQQCQEPSLTSPPGAQHQHDQEYRTSSIVHGFKKHASKSANSTSKFGSITVNECSNYWGSESGSAPTFNLLRRTYHRIPTIKQNNIHVSATIPDTLLTSVC